MSAKFELPKFELPNTDSAGDKPARSPFGNLLETSKLSRLPSLPKRGAFASLPICGNCSKRLDASDDYQTAVGFCKTCLRTYAVVGVGVEKYTESKIRRNYLEGK